MKNNVILGEDQAPALGQILKVTALLYLKEALVNQEYESCPQLIDTAKKLGVSSSDISGEIAAYLRGYKAGGQNEANPQTSRFR